MLRTCALTLSFIALVAFCAPGIARADQSLINPASLHAISPAHYRVLFKTTAGSFTVDVTRGWAPIGADRFYNLVKHGYYNGNAFFRVVPHFVVQFGLSGNPAVNAAWSSARMVDDPVKQHNVAGTLTFADAGPNTRTTQLFVNLDDNSRLDSMGFAPFGRVISGMNVVERIFSGYQEQPDQMSITQQGDAYLRANFPRIDRIISARVLGH